MKGFLIKTQSNQNTHFLNHKETKNTEAIYKKVILWLK